MVPKSEGRCAVCAIFVKTEGARFAAGRTVAAAPIEEDRLVSDELLSDAPAIQTYLNSRRSQRLRRKPSQPRR